MLAAILPALAPDASAGGDGLFKAGASAIDVTPPRFPISMNGGMSDRDATQAADPLHARCLVLDDGTTRIAIVVCDSCAIPRKVFDPAKEIAARETGIPTSRMLMSATHTHSAPTVTAVFQSEPDEEYRRFLIERIAEGVARANANLRPARVGWGVGRDPSQVFNRRWYMQPGIVNTDPFGGQTDYVRMNPGVGNKDNLQSSGPIDPRIGILSVQSKDGQPIAVLANYSLHYVGGVPGDSVSADYFGEFARRLTAALQAGEADPPFVGIMSNGTSGNINNINFGLASLERREPFEQIQLVAASVVDATMKAYREIEHTDWAPIGMAETEVELGVRRPGPEDVARATEVLAEAGPGPYRDRTHIYARETLKLAEYPETVRAKLQAIRIGDLGIASSPCETFVETGLAVKEQSPLQPTFVIELANGYNGYLPTPEHHELGGYETWRARSSYLAVDAEPKIRSTILSLLDQVADVPADVPAGGPPAAPDGSEAPAKPVSATKAAAGGRPAATGERPRDIGLAVTNWDGVQALVRKHRGKVVAVNIWTTTCPACLEEFPGFVRMQQTFGRDDVACIAVNCDYDGIKTKPPAYYRDRVVAFLREQDAGILDNVLLDTPLIDFLDQIGLASSPAIYVYDRSGKLAKRFDNDNVARAEDEFTLSAVEALISELVEQR
ncbi:MAG TPA: redoxin family protein [Planctomycetaceae bacterium]|nr:redoxin family protein [Planctomycetaceae bacterium]